MSARSKYEGFDVVFKNNEWMYVDNGLSVTKIHRPCKYCGKYSTEEGNDGCLGTLIGVMNACCGHGIEKDAYIQFLDGESINGKDAIGIMNILKEYRR